MTENEPFGVDLVMRLFAFAKDADGIVNPASRARAGAIALGLFQAAAITGLADPLAESVVVRDING